jgi:hypothetical protein
LDQQLSYRAMKRHKGDTVTMFNKRFCNFYYKMPTNIHPSEVVSRLCYATNFHLDLAFVLMERRFVTLQHMFNVAKEVEDNIQACAKIS